MIRAARAGHGVSFAVDGASLTLSRPEAVQVARELRVFGRGDHSEGFVARLGHGHGWLPQAAELAASIDVACADADGAAVEVEGPVAVALAMALAVTYPAHRDLGEVGALRRAVGAAVDD